MLQNRFLLSLAVFVLAAASVRAIPVPCAGGQIDFTATSYDSAVAMTTFNVGQLVTLTAQPAGIAPSAFEWTIDGPHIKDYDERIGTTATGPIAWSTTALVPADMTSSTAAFYWKPSPSQIHPLNGGAVTRSVTLKVTVAATDCTVTQTFSVERNNTDIDKQAEDFYTRNHRAPTESDLTKGRVLDDHIEWHTVFGTRILDFLPWHHEFLDRANRWRAEFGYPPSLTWYPGNPIPTGIDMDDTTRGGLFDPDMNRIPTVYTIAGGSVGPPKRLADFATLANFSTSLEGSWHGQVHCNVGGTMCTFQSPRDPLFFRWHGMIDRLYENYCTLKSLACAGVTMPASDLWMADNATDLAANGAEPSSGTLWMSPSIWNRNSPAVCTPPDAAATVARSCGSAADHENPIAGVTNYLYATIRNDRPAAQEIKYLEVAVYIANASTGLTWPASFGGDPDGALPETRQFITVNVPAGQVTDIGPLPWVPPSPLPSDHWCVYVRALSEQAPIGVAEGASIAANVQASNSLIWRNLHIVVNSTDSARFTISNGQKRAARNTLRIEVPDKFFSTGSVRLLVPRAIAARWRQSGRLDGIEVDGPVRRDAKGLREMIAKMPAISQTRAGKLSPRGRELYRRISELQAAIRACSRGEKLPARAAAARPAVLGDLGSDPKSERELLDAIRQLERQLRACGRSDETLVAFRLTKPRASITGISLTAMEKDPVTIEFRGDSPDRADYPVLVAQDGSDGKLIGGSTYVVRTGTH
jgi:hypothetical protein